MASRERNLGSLAATTALLASCAILYLFIAFHLGIGTYDGAPDELMRALLPQAIADGNLLPSGYDPEVIYVLGNWSYAFYPQMLGSYISAAFMFLAQALGAGASLVFVSGRFASVLFSLVTLLCLHGFVRTILADRTGDDAQATFFGNVAIVLLGFWPQYSFISSYMNNEIVALCGVSIMTCALALGHLRGWTMRRALLLAAGVIIAALGYWNVYGFILAAIVLFISSVVRQECLSTLDKARLIAAAALLSAACVLPLFFVNLARYGDITGMSAFHDAYEAWLADGGEVLQHPYEQGLASLLFESGYVNLTVKSFIGCFGSMVILLPSALYWLYVGVALLCLGMFAVHAREYRSSLGAVFYVATAFSCAVTVALSLYYTLAVDYQAQGRYVIYLLLPLAAMMSLGVASVARGSRARQIACKVGCALYIALGCGIFAFEVVSNGWAGPGL